MSQENKDPQQEEDPQHEVELPATGEESQTEEKSPAGNQAIQALRQLSDEEKVRVIRAVGISVRRSSFSGPLPSPEAFEKYNRVLPNAADRILSMAEKEQQIRDNEIRGFQSNDRFKIRASTIVSICLVSVSCVSVFLGHTKTAVALGLSGVFSAIINLVTVLLARHDAGED